MGDLNPIQLSLAVPPVGPDDSTLGDLLRWLEGRFPGVELAWRAERVEVGGGGPPSARRSRLADRDGWVREQLGAGQAAHLWSGPGQVAVNVHLDPRGTVTQDGSRLGRVDVWLRDDAVPTDQLAELLGAAAGAVNALHASYIPLPAAALLTQLLYGAKLWPKTPAADLVAGNPALEQLPVLSPRPDRLATAAAPSQIGWLSYWSAATADYLEVGPAVERAFWRCHRIDAGAWLATLTAEVLDLRRPEHAAALVEAYRRLPRVGVRLPARQP